MDTIQNTLNYYCKLELEDFMTSSLFKPLKEFANPLRFLLDFLRNHI